MNLGVWHSFKSSPVMSELRESLKKKAAPGEPTLSRKEANRTWREDILGILSNDQKAEDKARRQRKSQQRKEVEE